jgi:hypothetical protein
LFQTTSPLALTTDNEGEVGPTATEQLRDEMFLIVTFISTGSEDR